MWATGIVLFAEAAGRLPPGNENPWIAAAGAPPLARWDSAWYRSVALDGYSYDPVRPENNVGFYPLYPLAVRFLSTLFHTPLLWTGIFFSLVCFLAALELTGDLFAAAADDDTAVHGVAALLLFPTSFFFAAVYTESLFLLAAVGVFWAARRGRWLLAGLCGAAASLTRFNGFLVAVALAWLLWERRRDMPVPAWLRAGAAAMIPLAGGALAFPAYLGRRFGDPLLYVHSKAAGWGKQASAPWTLALRVARGAWQRLRDPSPAYTFNFFLEAACAVLFLALTILVFRRGLAAEGLYAAATLLLLWSSSNLDGMPRFVLVLFPCFLPIGSALRRRPQLRFAYAFGGTGLGVVLLHRFVHWIIVA